MIELNLLPDVKLEFIKAQRARRLVIGVSLLASAAAIGVLILMFSFGLLQKKHLSDVNGDIASSTNELKGKKNINTILTVQNQLSSLTQLHESKPDASRLLGYLNQLTPVLVSLDSLNVDMTANTITISGNASSLSTVNQYVDTLKVAGYTTDGNNDKTRAFSDVLLQSFALSSDSTSGKPATFTIGMSYDPMIFDITKNPKLAVPKITNRTEASSLFEAPTASVNKGTN